MSRFSVSVAATGFAFLMVAAAISVNAQISNQTRLKSEASYSKARIVRLSDVRGAVQLDRDAGRGFEAATVNMPVVEQSRLKTGVGVAEVEFEDSSTLRIGPNSEVDFSLLGRTAEGNTVTAVRVEKGIAYVSLVKARGKTPNVFDLAFGGQRNIPLQPDTHVRLEVNGQQAKLAVLGGSVQLNEASGAVEVSRKHTATFALGSNAQPEVAKGIKSDSLLDTWDKQLDQYHARVASQSNFGGVPYSYGLNDMLYYGSFEDVGGCGEMWRPYFTSAAWNPYGSGMWASYGAGYSWVSPYPWGWTPYHYGSWSFCPGTGWGWMPGGSWMGINNVAAATTPAISAGGITVARRRSVLPHPPHPGGPSTVSVNGAALVRSGLTTRGSFAFVRNSAGLGVPRRELGNLKGFSRDAERRGVATTPIYFSYAPRQTSGVRGGADMARTPIAIHRAYAPSYGGYAGERASGNMGGGAPVSASGNSVSMQSAPAAAPSMGSSVHVSAPSGAGHH